MKLSAYSKIEIRNSTWNYLTGKAATGIISFICIILLVRELSISEYGAYVTFLASLEIIWAFSGMGLQWVATRFLPEFRLHGSIKDIKTFSLKLLYFKILTLLFSSFISLYLIDIYLSFFDLSTFRESALCFIPVIFFEGFGIFIRDSFLSPLLLNLQIRNSIVIRKFSFLIIITIMSIAEKENLYYVSIAELSASTIGSLFAFYYFLKFLGSFDKKNTKNYKDAPKFGQILRIAKNMYGSHILSLAYSPQIFLQILQRTLGNEASAIFGFLKSLYLLISNNLPASLLINIIKPKLVAGYVGGGGVKELKENANLSGKISMFFLIPIIVFSAISGEKIVLFLSGGKFPDTGYLLFYFLLVAIPISQRQILETAAVACGFSKLCIFASSICIFVTPFMIGLLEFGFGLWSTIISLFSGQLLFDLIIVYWLGIKTSYKIDYLGFSKLILIGTITFIMALFIPDFTHYFLDIIINGIFCFMAFLILCWFLKPFNEYERLKTNNFIGLRIFVW